MYDELIKRLRAFCEGCKLWDGYKCCLKGECSEQKSLQAADAIKELLAEQEENYADSWKMAFEVERDTHRWIPVTERLPEDRNMVLATVDGVVRIAFYGNYMWEEVETYSIFYPTHWMPLPQPPKDGET